MKRENASLSLSFFSLQNRLTIPHIRTKSFSLEHIFLSSKPQYSSQTKFSTNVIVNWILYFFSKVLTSIHFVRFRRFFCILILVQSTLSLKYFSKSQYIMSVDMFDFVNFIWILYSQTRFFFLQKNKNSFNHPH